MGPGGLGVRHAQEELAQGAACAGPGTQGPEEAGGRRNPLGLALSWVQPQREAPLPLGPPRGVTRRETVPTALQ